MKMIAGCEVKIIWMSTQPMLQKMQMYLRQMHNLFSQISFHFN